jgi:CspA family cold shock protein
MVFAHGWSLKTPRRIVRENICGYSRGGMPLHANRTYMIKGTLKFFNAAKGFGFITPDGEGKDVFLPATTIAAAGGAKLQAGQRVSFEQEADVKGPKAVQLKLLDEAPPRVAPPPPPPPPRAQLTIHCDPSSDDAADVLAELAAAGRQVRVMDYTTTPPDRAELQRMSLVLRNADQSLVHRYNPLFLDLQLDDRFIAESDFWTAIVEHPALINGPVLVEGNNIRICKTAGDVRAFLGQEGAADVKKAPKEISARMAAMMRGQAVPPPPPPAPMAAPKPIAAALKPPAPAPKPVAPAAPAQKIEKPVATKATAPKPAAKPKQAAKPQKAVPAKKAAPAKKAVKPKPATAKPAKKPATKKKGK